MNPNKYFKAIIVGLIAWLVCASLVAVIFVVYSENHAPSFESVFGRAPEGNLNHACRNGRLGGEWQYKPCTATESFFEGGFLLILGASIAVLFILAKPSNLFLVERLDGRIVWLLLSPFLFVAVSILTCWLLKKLRIKKKV